MTRKVTRKTYTLRVVAQFFGMLTILITLAAPAQMRDKSSAARGSVNRFQRNKFSTESVDPTDSGAPLFLFVPALTYHSGGPSASLKVADVNRDGKPDIVVSDSDIGIEVLLGNSDGSFQAAVPYASGGTGPTSVAVADVNGDGKPDVAITNFYSNTVGVLLGNGDGTFQPALTYSSLVSGGSNPDSVAIADMNGDNKPDLVVANYSGDILSKRVAVFLGNGDGTFQSAIGYSSSGVIPESITVSDVNGDGKLDVLVVNFWASNQDLSHGSVDVLLGNGDGTFQGPITYSTGGAWSISLAVADVNRDGKPDLIAGNSNQGTAGVLLGKGDGTFQAAVTYSLGGLAGASVAVVDLNGDGKPDLVAASCAACDNAVAVLVGNGDGTFQTALSYGPGGYGSTSVAIADVNGDNRPDLLVATCDTSSCSSGAIGVLLHVGVKSTTTTFVSSLNPSVYGQVITLTATVSATAGTPTGEVAFFDGSKLLGSATLIGHSASFSVSMLSAATHSIAAVYEGSLKYNSSASVPISEVVNTATTTTSLASSHNPALVNQPVIYTATVTSQYYGVVVGTMIFRDGSSTIATVAVTSNIAKFRAKYPAAGVHAITATYSGDENNVGSASPTLMEQVLANTKTVVTTSGSPSRVGDPVTFTATVTSPFGAIPDGELVTFYDGTKALGSGATASGVATLTTSTLTVRTHSIKAIYPGDTTFKPSTGKVTQVVQP